VKSFKSYIQEKSCGCDDDHASKLGPEATKRHDSEEIQRQKKHLTDKATENHAQAARERVYGHGGAAEAKAQSYENARDNIKEEGMMTVAAAAGTGDSRLPADQREPGVSKKRNPVMQNLARRALPKV